MAISINYPKSICNPQFIFCSHTNYKLMISRGDALSHHEWRNEDEDGVEGNEEE